MPSTVKLLIVFGGALIGLLIGLIIIIAIHNDRKIKTRYDERQELVRGKAYKYSFYFLCIAMGALVLVDMVPLNLPVSYGFIIFTSLLIALGIYTTYAISHDGYVGLNEKKGTASIAFLFIAIANLIIGILNMVRGIAYDDFHPFENLSQGLMNIECGLFLAVISIVMLTRSDKEGDEADEESED